MTPEDLEILKAAILLVAFGIVLPSFDTYSDISFSYSLINGTYETRKGCTYCKASPQPVYGSVMLIPILITTLFSLPHWLKRENTWRKRLLTFPLFIVQFWPQWQALKILKLMKNRNVNWRSEREKFQKEISSLGKYFFHCLIFLFHLLL